MPDPVQFDPNVKPARKSEIITWIQAELQADVGAGKLIHAAMIPNAAQVYKNEWPTEPPSQDIGRSVLVFLPGLPGGPRLSVTKKESVPIGIMARIMDNPHDLVEQFLDSCLARVHTALVGKVPVITNGRCVTPLQQDGAATHPLRELEGTHWTAMMLLRTAVAPS